MKKAVFSIWTHATLFFTPVDVTSQYRDQWRGVVNIIKALRITHNVWAFVDKLCDCRLLKKD
jgi:hypothetical protein